MALLIVVGLEILLFVNPNPNSDVFQNAAEKVLEMVQKARKGLPVSIPKADSSSIIRQKPFAEYVVNSDVVVIIKGLLNADLYAVTV